MTSTLAPYWLLLVLGLVWGLVSAFMFFLLSPAAPTIDPLGLLRLVAFWPAMSALWLGARLGESGISVDLVTLASACGVLTSLGAGTVLMRLLRA